MISFCSSRSIARLRDSQQATLDLTLHIQAPFSFLQTALERQGNRVVLCSGGSNWKARIKMLDESLHDADKEPLDRWGLGGFHMFPPTR